MSHYSDHLDRADDERAAARASVKNADVTGLPIGFLNAEFARIAIRRVKLRRALLNAQSLIPALLDRLDQASDPLGDASSIDIERRIHLARGDVARGVGRKSIDRVEGDDVREQELLQGADLVLQFLNSLLRDLAHGRFSINHSDNPDATPAQPAAHRLSDGPSRT